ncbi:zinc-binding protein A33-like [Alosa sapidissima]|uniref:zinc-binding protein A33-like n=1 Tax=Alosa sapidissima TaxID=34773 RepID=UPI001C083E15|nr:zinc-binding protein A33-like [Alosa sapidissima]
MMKEKIEKMNKEISSLSSTIKALAKEMGAGPNTLLQNYKSTVERAQCTLQYPEGVSGALINVAKHLGNLKFRVWEKIKDTVQYTPVTLDPNTAHPNLLLSEDLTGVRLSEERQQLPENPERFDRLSSVLGAEGFNSETHSWDVELRDSDVWFLHVKTESSQRKGGVSCSKDIWGVGQFSGEYEIVFPSKPVTPLNVKLKLERIRVQLDWDRGEFSFSDCLNNIDLHTFTHTFTERVFPYIYTPDSLKIVPGTY